eukprot:15480357-Alexandrium_andersonii.AAC.1
MLFATNFLETCGCCFAGVGSRLHVVVDAASDACIPLRVRHVRHLELCGNAGRQQTPTDGRAQSYHVLERA